MRCQNARTPQSDAITDLDDKLEILDVSLLGADELKDAFLSLPFAIWQSFQRRRVNDTGPGLQVLHGQRSAPK